MPIYNQKAIEDARVIQSSPTENYGDWEYMSIANGSSSSQTGEIFLKFDLVSIPAFSSIISASLRLFQYNEADDWLSPTIQVAAELCGAVWSEGTIKWSNKPGNAAGTPQAFTSFSNNISTYVSFDVKNHIQGIVNGTFANHGFRLRYTGTSSETRKYFRSREYSNSAFRPALIIEYELPFGKIAPVNGEINKTVIGMKLAPVIGMIEKNVIGMKIAPIEGGIDKTVF